MNQHTLEYKGKMVFQRMTMSSDFERIPKYFKEDEACFLFLTEGAFSFRTPTQQIEFTQGDGLLAKCGNYYIENTNPKITNKKNTLSFIGAYFYPTIVKSFFQSDLSQQHFHTDFDATKVDVKPLLKSFLDSLDFLFDNPSVVDENLIGNKLKELLILLSKSEQADSINSLIDSLFDPISYNFQEIINANLYANLSLEELSHLCNYSISTFKRFFYKIYDSSPAKYINNKKLEKSVDLLLNQNKLISEIAFEVGFDNQASFNKSFKKKYSKSPSEFRLSQ